LLGFAHNHQRCTFYAVVTAPGRQRRAKLHKFGRVCKFGISGAAFASRTAELSLTHLGSVMDRPVHGNHGRPLGAKGVA
jgi:hypothetical protein